MNDASNSPAIYIRGVSRHFAGRKVLDGIDLAVERGEFFALVGPSGSGKSTLLKMVSGIDQPTAGEVWLEGENVTHVPPYRRPVHTVFQNYALFPHLSVAGNVGFPLKVAGVARNERDKKVKMALDLVKMGAFASRQITNLSGGERQRVAVARALVDEPRCILFDEPLSALDPHLRVATLAMIQEIQDRLRITYLYVTHDRQEALRAAHRVAVLKDGTLRQVGSPEELYRRPNSPFVASFLGPINWLSAERTDVNGRPAVRLADGAVLPLQNGVLPASQQITLGVRPEEVHIGGEGLVSAEVLSLDFCGSSQQVHLTLADGTKLTADMRGDLPHLVKGAKVRVSWDVDSMRVFGGSPEMDLPTEDKLP
jgi:ABC-type Fe3+/spermidine/putrescine transport system ATPase subunit